MRLSLDAYRSPLGGILLVTASDGTLCALDFADGRQRMERLLALHYQGYVLEHASAPMPLRNALDAYFAGNLTALDAIAVREVGHPFQRNVWRALRSIPAGTTTTYGRLAAELGVAGSARAVGTANGQNPVMLVVPCHRVIGANGALRGYAGGLLRKRWLLAHEAAHRPAHAPTKRAAQAAPIT